MNLWNQIFTLKTPGMEDFSREAMEDLWQALEAECQQQTTAFVY